MQGQCVFLQSPNVVPHHFQGRSSPASSLSRSCVPHPRQQGDVRPHALQVRNVRQALERGMSAAPPMQRRATERRASRPPPAIPPHAAGRAPGRRTRADATAQVLGQRSRGLAAKLSPVRNGRRNATRARTWGQIRYVGSTTRTSRGCAARRPRLEPPGPAAGSVRPRALPRAPWTSGTRHGAGPHAALRRPAWRWSPAAPASIPAVRPGR